MSFVFMWIKATSLLFRGKKNPPTHPLAVIAPLLTWNACLLA